MINFLKRNSKANDTCYIATYDELDWAGLNPTDNEKGCDVNKYDCHFMILDNRRYIMKYRIGTRTKSYRLILKNKNL